MSPTSILLLLLIGSPAIVVESASLRDYVASAAHVVGLDSLVSGSSSQEEVVTSDPMTAEASAPLPRCCEQLPQPPCGPVKEVVVPEVVASPVACPPVEKPPCATVCPIDYEAANAKSHSRMWEVALKGRDLAAKLTGKLAAPIVYTNDKISEAAGLLPGVLGAKGRILGSALSLPIQFAVGKSSLVAKGISGVMVGVPVAIGTGVAAGVSGLMEKVAEIGRQEEACLCAAAAAAAAAAKGKKHHVVEAVNHCPCAPGLVAAGSKNEETFSIEEPVTDSPVTEAMGGNQADSQVSVTDSTFTTTITSVQESAAGGILE